MKITVGYSRFRSWNIFESDGRTDWRSANWRCANNRIPIVANTSIQFRRTEKDNRKAVSIATPLLMGDPPLHRSALAKKIGGGE